jgi:transcriptional regulator with GAF, ATPase, and Fis domain
VSCIEERKTLEREREWLLTELRAETGAGRILGRSPVLRKVLDQIAVVAPTPANVLILGESGTGKELVARAIHEMSSRREKPLVRVNCASIPKDLFESEFFGHVRGAFTGAVKDRTGRFELAQGGTLFLDEVGEIPIDLQSKLLRVLQEGQFERVGEDRTRTVDVRVVAATNRDLETEAQSGRFRLDLFYRLSVFPIELPPLRERPEDIAPLAAHFVAQSAARLGFQAPRLLAAHLQQLEAYPWPGNVRELQNVVERAVILSRGGSLQFALRPAERQGSSPPVARAGTPAPATGDSPSLAELEVRERQILTQALERSRGRIYGPQGAAALLGLKPTTLVSRLQRIGLSPRVFRD